MGKYRSNDSVMREGYGDGPRQAGHETVKAWNDGPGIPSNPDSLQHAIEWAAKEDAAYAAARGNWQSANGIINALLAQRLSAAQEQEVAYDVTAVWPGAGKK